MARIWRLLFHSRGSPESRPPMELPKLGAAEVGLVESWSFGVGVEFGDWRKFEKWIW